MNKNAQMRYNDAGQMSHYSIPPFSGPKYRENAARCKDDETPCAICGRPVREPWPHSAIVIDGGAAWGDEQSPVDSAHMGSFPVGATCHEIYR